MVMETSIFSVALAVRPSRSMRGLRVSRGARIVTFSLFPFIAIENIWKSPIRNRDLVTHRQISQQFWSSPEKKWILQRMPSPSPFSSTSSQICLGLPSCRTFQKNQRPLNRSDELGGRAACSCRQRTEQKPAKSVENSRSQQKRPPKIQTLTVIEMALEVNGQVP